MDRQLRVGTMPRPNLFVPPTNGTGCSGAKPDGGLWTSTYHETEGSGWVQWCLGSDYSVPRIGWESWLLTPDPTARILTIDSYQDLRRVLRSYGRRPFDFLPSWPSQLKPDFEKIVLDYDAVHLTQEGLWATHLSHPYDLYGWDCESTVWLRWAFTEVKSLGRVKWDSPVFAESC